MALMARDHVLLKYKTGDVRWRHAVILEAADGVFHRVLTTGRVVRRLDFSSAEIDKIASWDGKKLSSKLKRQDCFIDLDSPSGAFTEEEINQAVAGLAAAVRRRVRTKGPPAQGESAVVPHDDDDVERGGEEEPRPGGRTVDVADGEGWYVLVGQGAVLSGQMVKLAGKDPILLGDMALFQKSGKTLVAVWAKAEEVLEKLRALRVRSSGHPEARFEGIGDIFYDADATPRRKATDDAKVDDDPDLRVLPVKFERDGRRFRRLQDAQVDMEEEAFDDWPLDTKRSLTHTLRELRRADLSWLQHHDNWMKVSGVRVNDRSAHEHQLLCTALHWFTCYDQICVVNSAGCETLNARRELIEHAHEGRPEAPRWDGADDFLGKRQAAGGTIIDPDKLAHVAARQSQRAKILETSMKAQEASAAWLRRGRGGDGAADDHGRLTKAQLKKQKALETQGGADV